MVFMKNTARIIAFLMAALMMLTVFVGCRDDKGDPNQTTANNGTTVSTDPANTEEVSLLPAKDWDGREYFILGIENTTHPQFTSIEIVGDELTGDVVKDAVYTRNQQLKSKYNFVVKQEIKSSPSTVALNLYNTNEHVYDTVLYYTTDMVKHAQQQYLYDLHTVPNINLAYSSWNQAANAELTIGGKLYLANSDFLLQAKARTYFMMYNREMLHSHEAFEGLYIEDEYVENGTWTVAQFYEIAKDFAEDLDGGGVGGLMDQWALCADGHNVASCFAYGAGYRLTVNNDGVLSLAEVTPKTIDIIDQCIKATLDPNLTLHSNRPLQGINDRSGIDTFEDGRSLFLSDLPSSFDIGLDLDFEYGILPYPKYDAAQEKYYTKFNWSGAESCAIPYTTTDTEFVGFCLEAITEESTDTSMTAYYDQKCKLHESYDQRCSDMLDVLYANVVFDMGAILNAGGLDTMLSSTIPTYYPANAFSRLYDKGKDAAEEVLTDIMESW